MKEENIKSYTKRQLDAMIARGEGKTNFAALDAMKDEDIDTSDIPELGDWFWDNAVLVEPRRKKGLLTVRLDGDLLDWLKRQGKGYQTKINAILRTYMIAQLNKKSRHPKERHS